MSGKPPAAAITSKRSGAVPGQLSAPNAAGAAQSKIVTTKVRSLIT
ncbi:MAG TPA: hypothetical protein VHY10_20000 [Xanthobacteraceae bacterium]|nr:hypothetical protein [Xanthobacteraceae bacterium]